MKKIAILITILILLSASLVSAEKIMPTDIDPSTGSRNEFVNGPFVRINNYRTTDLECGTNNVEIYLSAWINNLKGDLGKYLGDFVNEYTKKNGKPPTSSEINKAVHEDFLSKNIDHEGFCGKAIEAIQSIDHTCPNKCSVKDPKINVLNNMWVRPTLYLRTYQGLSMGHEINPITSKEDYDAKISSSYLMMSCDVYGKVTCSPPFKLGDNIKEQPEEKSSWRNLWGLFSSKDNSQEPPFIAAGQESRHITDKSGYNVWWPSSAKTPVKVFAPNELAIQIKESACGKTELSPEDIILAGYLPGGSRNLPGFDFPTKPPKAVEEAEQFLASCAKLGNNPSEEDVVLAVESFAPKEGWAAWYHALKGSHSYRPTEEEGKEINRPEVKDNLIARCKEVANNPTLASREEIRAWLDAQSSDAIIVKTIIPYKPGIHTRSWSHWAVPEPEEGVIANKHNFDASSEDYDGLPPKQWLAKTENDEGKDNLDVILASYGPKTSPTDENILAARTWDPGDPWPPWNGWPTYIPQKDNPCQKISDEKVVITQTSIKIGDKEYTPEQVQLTKLTPGFLAAKLDLPGKPGGPAQYPTGPSVKARANRPVWIPPGGIIKETPGSEDAGWIDNELASRWWYGPDADSALQPPKAREQPTEQQLAGFLPGGKRQTPGMDLPGKPPKAQEEQDQSQLASVIPGRDTIMPPLAAKQWSKEGGWFMGEDDLVVIVIPGGPQEEQKLCTKNVELDPELKDFKPFPTPLKPRLASKPGIPPSIPPYPGLPPSETATHTFTPKDFTHEIIGSPFTAQTGQKYEEINPQDLIRLQISKDACSRGETIAKGIISIPKEEIKLAMINLPESGQIANYARHYGRTVWIQNPRPGTYTARKDIPGYVPPRGAIREATPAQLPPAPKLPEVPKKQDISDKDCCIKCQPFQARTVSISEQCPEEFNKRILGACASYDPNSLRQKYCGEKAQQVSAKIPLPSMPPTVPRPRNDLLASTQSRPCCVSCETNQEADLGQTECNRGNVWVDDCNSEDYRDPAHTNYLCQKMLG